MRVEVRQEGQALLVELDVELEVRRGRLAPDDMLRYPPWTGDTFRAVRDIPELAGALEAREARFAAWIRARHRPFASLGVALALILSGVVQLFAARWSHGGAGTTLHLSVLKGAIGFESLVLDGAWWTPWTSQLLHAGPGHLATNLAIVAYCGLRVERAFGVGGYAVIAASAVLVGTVAITLFGALPVVGASVLAFGLWGAQIAIGFRMGDAVPTGWRGFYGWGNLFLFVPLFVAGLGLDGVSHLGHLGGLLGGVLAALLVPSEALVPERRVRERRRVNIGIASALALLPMFAGPLLARAAPTLAAPGERVEVPEAGVSIELPWRMSDNPVSLIGLPAWVLSKGAEEPLFCGLVRLTSHRTPDTSELGEAWSAALGAPLEPVDAPPPPPGDGWESRAWQVRDASGERVVGRLVEHDLRRGRWLLRTGYYVASSDAEESGKEALFRHVIGTLDVSDLPTIVKARRERALYPDDPERAWTWARALSEAGRFAESEDVWAGLGRIDTWRWEAARGRLENWRDAERAGAEAALEARVPREARSAWPEVWLAQAPVDDLGLHAAGVAWLTSHGRCGPAEQHLARLERVGVDTVDLRAALAACAVR